MSTEHPPRGRIVPCSTPDHYARARDLIRQYTESYKVAQTREVVEYELNHLGEKYTDAQGGTLLLAEIVDDIDGQPSVDADAQLAAPAGTDRYVGVVGVAPCTGYDKCAEMKRLFVSSAGRGRGLGKMLAEAALDHAKRLGYREMKLDTITSSVAAHNLYVELGFQECEKYYENLLKVGHPDERFRLDEGVRIVYMTRSLE